MKVRLVIALLALITASAGAWYVLRPQLIGEATTAGTKYPMLTYHARIYAHRRLDGVRVTATVQIGPGDRLSAMYHDCGTLGTSPTMQAAVEKWGRPEFRTDGLHIGHYFLPRKQLESHR